MKVRTLMLFVVTAVLCTALIGCAQTSGTKYDQGPVLQQQKKYDQAIKAYQDYITERPQGALVPLAMYHVAECYAEKGQKDEAKAAYMKLTEMYPKEAPAQWAMDDMKKMDAAQAAPAAVPAGK